MAATQGTAIFVGGGRTFVKDVYLSDTVNTAVNWSQGAAAAATTPEKWSPPVPVTLVDVSVVTGAAQTRLQVTRNQAPTGDVLAHSIQLNTLANRPRLSIPFNQGDEVAMIQLA